LRYPAQTIKINPGVKRRRVEMPVPQYIGNFFQRCPTLNEAGSCGASQHVDAMKSRVEARTYEGASDEVIDGNGVDRLIVRRDLPDKDGTITRIGTSVL
jgi:hypothetical protein